MGTQRGSKLTLLVAASSLFLFVAGCIARSSPQNLVAAQSTTISSPTPIPIAEIDPSSIQASSSNNAVILKLSTNFPILYDGANLLCNNQNVIFSQGGSNPDQASSSLILYSPSNFPQTAIGSICQIIILNSGNPVSCAISFTLSPAVSNTFIISGGATTFEGFFGNGPLTDIDVEYSCQVAGAPKNPQTGRASVQASSSNSATQLSIDNPINGSGVCAFNIGLNGGYSSGPSVSY